VIKVHNTAGNPADFARLQAAVADLPGTVLLTQTLSRREIYELESACDCFVSLHRSEGFGLAPAECMYLGKPVISTDWSATAEFSRPPIARTLPAGAVERNHGPYGKGQIAGSRPRCRLMRCRPTPASAPPPGAAHATIVARFPGVVGARHRRRLEGIACLRLARWAKFSSPGPVYFGTLAPCFVLRVCLFRPPRSVPGRPVHGL
jgi:hypothetical protein